MTECDTGVDLGYNKGMEKIMNLFPAPAGVAPMVEAKMLKSLRRYAEYRANVHKWYSVPNQPYSYPECIHGVSRWTAYDNICLGCEMGYGEWDFGRELQDAYNETVSMLAEVDRRSDMIRDLLWEEDIPHSLREGLAKWVYSDLKV